MAENEEIQSADEGKIEGRETPPGTDPIDIAENPIARCPTNINQKPAFTQEDGSMERRTFIKWLTIGWSAFAAIVAGYGVFVLRYLFPNVLFEPKQSFLAGFPDEYEIGVVSERFKGQQGVWIVRDTEKLYY